MQGASHPFFQQNYAFTRAGSRHRRTRGASCHCPTAADHARDREHRSRLRHSRYELSCLRPRCGMLKPREFFMASVVKIENIQRDLQAVRDDVSRLTQQMTNLVSLTGSKALREVKEQIGPLEDAVRERPFAALAVAVGLGFLFGAIWRLR